MATVVKSPTLHGMAEQARAKPPRDRRYSVFAIVKLSIMPERMFDGKELRLGRGVRPRMEARRTTVSRVFLDAYGDETGTEYWRAWIDATDPDPDEKIARLLATHVAAEKEGRIGKDRDDSFDWRARSEIRSWVEKRCKDALSAISKNRSLRERIDEMAADPNNEGLIPPSLRRFLLPPIVATTAPSASATTGATTSDAALKPMSGLKKREVERFVIQQGHSSDDEATRAARAEFPGYTVTRELIRSIRRKANLRGKAGRPSKQKSRA
jgi:hypothetical protein